MNEIDLQFGKLFQNVQSYFRVALCKFCYLPQQNIEGVHFVGFGIKYEVRIEVTDEVC